MKRLGAVRLCPLEYVEKTFQTGSVRKSPKHAEHVPSATWVNVGLAKPIAAARVATQWRDALDLPMQLNCLIKLSPWQRLAVSLTLPCISGPLVVRKKANRIGDRRLGIHANHHVDRPHGPAG